jgi:hypothetical protein
MRGAIPPLPKYAFMAWCSVKRSTGTTLLSTFYEYNWIRVNITALTGGDFNDSIRNEFKLVAQTIKVKLSLCFN